MAKWQQITHSLLAQNSIIMHHYHHAPLAVDYVQNTQN